VGRPGDGRAFRSDRPGNRPDVSPSVEPRSELIRPALEGLVPNEPGKPVEVVQRELGLDRVVKLASNEGPFGPFPVAIEAIRRALPESNRYPDGGCYRLRETLAERHGVRFEEVIVAAGADAVIGYVCQSTLDPGDEIVTPWPSFPSYVLDPLKAAAVTVRVPLDVGRVDVDALLAAVTSRTKLAFVPTVNNPTGTMTPREDLLRFLDAVPEHVLTVIDEAYFQYVEDPSFPDAIEEAAKRGRNVLALRTFSKIFGLAGLRIGYGVGPAGVVSAIRKVQRAFDVTTPAQEAALASLDDDAELERRRAVNRDAMAALEAVLREHGFDPISPAVGNFLFVDVGEDAAALDQRLLRRGVIVRPMGSFGAPSALRITAGTPEEIAFLAEQLDAVLVPEAGRIPVS
jgi:histidinol-phosphate aminotransferase